MLSCVGLFHVYGPSVVINANLLVLKLIFIIILQVPLFGKCYFFKLKTYLNILYSYAKNHFLNTTASSFKTAIQLILKNV